MPASEMMVIDASVSAKWFLKDEGDTELADDILLGILAGDIQGHVPRIASYEVCGLLTKACLTRKADATKRITLEKAMACAREWFGLPLEIHDATELEGIEALRMAVEYSQQHYDMTYLRLAIQLNCPWCTADEQILKANPPTFPTRQILILRNRNSSEAG